MFLASNIGNSKLKFDSQKASIDYTRIYDRTIATKSEILICTSKNAAL